MTPSPGTRPLRIATRESPLALWQSNFVAAQLRRLLPALEVQLVPVSTGGDRDRVQALTQIGGQGLFTREVQRAVIEGKADLAVHSLKDLPTESAPELVLAGVPARAARFDALVLPQGSEGTLEDLPEGARVGTGSPRRRAQIRRMRSDLQLVELRGNIDTRLRKVDEGEVDAAVLAEAGLRRLELGSRISQQLIPPLVYPAVGQGALGIECRADDDLVLSLLRQITDVATYAEVLAERACLRELRAGCHAPVGVLSSVHDQMLELEAVVLDPSGSLYFHTRQSGSTDDPESIGRQAAASLIQQGAAAVLTAPTR